MRNIYLLLFTCILFPLTTAINDGSGVESTLGNVESTMRDVELPLANVEWTMGNVKLRRLKWTMCT